MMDPTMLLGAAGAGAGVQIFKQLIADQHNLAEKALENSIKRARADNESANDAAKRASGWGRRFALVTVLTVAFVGLLLAAYMQIPVSQIVYREPILNLLGMLKLGGGEKVIQATGLVLPEYVGQSVQIIIAFYFGASAAKR
jgi:hypothetical protein